MDETQKRVLSSLQGLCSRQECCTSDLLSKALKRLDGDAGAASQVVASLVEDGYADDVRYARAYASEKSALTGWGPYRIRMGLQAKGICQETIAEAIQAIDNQRSEERLLKLLQSKWRTVKDDPQAKLKLIRFALTRGYEYDSVRDLADRVCRQKDDQAI